MEKPETFSTLWMSVRKHCGELMIHETFIQLIGELLANEEMATHPSLLEWKSAFTAILTKCSMTGWIVDMNLLSISCLEDIRCSVWSQLLKKLWFSSLTFTGGPIWSLLKKKKLNMWVVQKRHHLSVISRHSYPKGLFVSAYIEQNGLKQLYYPHDMEMSLWLHTMT